MYRVHASFSSGGTAWPPILAGIVGGGAKPVRVLIVDDSSIVRRTLAEVLGADPGIAVLATASDPYVAAEKIRRQVPDVILLVVEMPRMDGLTFLRKIMAQHPIPVVICSSLTEAGAETPLRALEYGAVDIIHKPRIGARQFLEETRIRLLDAVRAAAGARVRPLAARPDRVAPKLTADAVLRRGAADALVRTRERVIVIGVSTGGTEAVRLILEALPDDAPGVVIVQHMPENFTRAFAARLDGLCAVEVREAQNNDSVIPGRALIEPGNLHTLLKRSGARYYVEVRGWPLVCRHRPSVDVIFRSAARYAGANALGVILTGMGDDGARRHARDVRGGGHDARPGRGELRRLRDAEGGDQAPGRRARPAFQGPAAEMVYAGRENEAEEFLRQSLEQTNRRQNAGEVVI